MEGFLLHGISQGAIGNGGKNSAQIQEIEWMIKMPSDPTFGLRAAKWLGSMRRNVSSAGKLRSGTGSNGLRSGFRGLRHNMSGMFAQLYIQDQCYRGIDSKGNV
jgi:hypothetical protein